MPFDEARFVDVDLDLVYLTTIQYLLTISQYLFESHLLGENDTNYPKNTAHCFRTK